MSSLGGQRGQSAGGAPPFTSTRLRNYASKLDAKIGEAGVAAWHASPLPAHAPSPLASAVPLVSSYTSVSMPLFHADSTTLPPLVASTSPRGNSAMGASAKSPEEAGTLTRAVSELI